MKLTVGITTFNRPDQALEAVRSVCSHHDMEYDLIVVDDASETWCCEKDISDVAGSPSRVIYHDRNMGLAVARNTAITIAVGEMFSFCDDDDQWPPEMASRLISALDAAPADVGMAIAISEDRRGKCGYLFENYPRLTELMKAGLTPPVGSQIYRTELLRQVGGYRREVSSGVDHDLWISLARIDPRVAVAWGEPAVVGSCPSRERMTTVEHRRRAGIEKSLEIWRDDLCEVFGERFYRHFVDSYRWYLDYTFFIKSIQKREYLDTALRAVRKPRLPIEAIKRRWDRMRGRSRCTLFPEFEGD